MEGLLALAQSMLATAEEFWPDRGDSPIPAGYTYLGQFIAHELTYDSSDAPPCPVSSGHTFLNRRKPGFDLKSLYGDGPEGASSYLYESDRLRLRQGVIRAVRRKGPDVPREACGRAQVFDPRNDSSLTLSQLTAALISFHNAVCAWLEKKKGRKPSFKEARRIVVEHVQSIVLHDYVWRIVPDRVYADIMERGPRLLDNDSESLIPLEFSHAAFRFGHSMVRGGYRWNSTIRRAKLDDLFKRSWRNGRMLPEGLNIEWQTAWDNFFDCSVLPDVERHKSINYARRINTSVNPALGTLPAGEREFGEDANLIQRDLLRGAFARLGTGQEAVQACIAKGVYPTSLRPEELLGIRSDATREVMRKHGFDRRTPLFLYILAEAELCHDGAHLGDLGGRIVMETIFTSIRCSQTSILRRKRWQTSLPSLRKDFFSMPDMLRFAKLV